MLLPWPPDIEASCFPLLFQCNNEVKLEINEDDPETIFNEEGSVTIRWNLINGKKNVLRRAR